MLWLVNYQYKAPEYYQSWLDEHIDDIVSFSTPDLLKTKRTNSHSATEQIIDPKTIVNKC